MRIRLSLMPASRRSAADRRLCVVVAGCTIVVLASPKLAVRDIRRVASITVHAARCAPRTRNESTPPKALCCLAARACPGCVCSPA